MLFHRPPVACSRPAHERCSSSRTPENLSTGLIVAVLGARSSWIAVWRTSAAMVRGSWRPSALCSAVDLTTRAEPGGRLWHSEAGI